MTETDNVVPINLGKVGDSTQSISAVELSKRLQKSMLKLKGKYMSEDGKGVDYGKLSKSSEFAVYSLDDIEHGILRCNSPHPASIKPQLSDKDPRKEFVLKKLDPRIHFALVCGAKSCPAINVYTVENVDKALDNATRSFCQQEVITRNDQNEVWLSKIFQWYRADFGETEVDVLRWIMPYLSKSESDRCSILILKLEKMGPVALRYNPYDWAVNSL